MVTVDELVIGVAIALGEQVADACENIDADSNGRVTVNELVQAVQNLLLGCEGHGDATATPTLEASATPTLLLPSPTAMFTPTPSPTPPPECLDAVVSPTFFEALFFGTARVNVEAADDCCWHTQFVANKPYWPCPADAPGSFQEVRCGSSEVQIDIWCDHPAARTGVCWRIAGQDVFVGCQHVTPAFEPTRTRTPRPTTTP